MTARNATLIHGAVQGKVATRRSGEDMRRVGAVQGIAIRGIALALAVTGALATSASASAVAPAGRSNYWTAVLFWDPDISLSNLYLENGYSDVVVAGLRDSSAGQSWHMVQTDHPGWTNVFQLHSGLWTDGTQCLTYFTTTSGVPLVDVGDCTSGYATYWQKQYVS